MGETPYFFSIYYDIKNIDSIIVNTNLSYANTTINWLDWRNLSSYINELAVML